MGYEAELIVSYIAVTLTYLKFYQRRDIHPMILGGYGLIVIHELFHALTDNLVHRLALWGLFISQWEFFVGVLEQHSLEMAQQACNGLGYTSWAAICYVLTSDIWLGSQEWYHFVLIASVPYVFPLHTPVSPGHLEYGKPPLALADAIQYHPPPSPPRQLEQETEAVLINLMD